jgi:cytochrome oxidase Cu insertion factor (SCO1/SenC/PrrC family)
VVVSSDQRETVVHSNDVLHADMDGVFMGMGRYQRYRQAVADRIQAQTQQSAEGK